MVAAPLLKWLRWWVWLVPVRSQELRFKGLGAETDRGRKRPHFLAHHLLGSELLITLGVVSPESGGPSAHWGWRQICPSLQTASYISSLL